MTDSTGPTRVLIADDHPMFRRGVADTIEACPDFELVGEASGGREALNLVLSLHPDVLVTDVDMPDLGGLELAAHLRNNNIATRVALLTMHQEMRFVRKAMDLGVHAYILKDDSVDGVVDGIKAAARGDMYLSPSLAPAVLAMNTQSTRDPRKQANPGLYSLTKSERRILKLVAQNKMTKEIASDLGISPRTVSTHRNNIANKLGLTDKLPLLNWALLNQEEILDLD